MRVVVRRMMNCYERSFVGRHVAPTDMLPLAQQSNLFTEQQKTQRASSASAEQSSTCLRRRRPPIETQQIHRVSESYQTCCEESVINSAGIERPNINRPRSAKAVGGDPAADCQNPQIYASHVHIQHTAPRALTTALANDIRHAPLKVEGATQARTCATFNFRALTKSRNVLVVNSCSEFYEHLGMRPTVHDLRAKNQTTKSTKGSNVECLAWPVCARVQTDLSLG